MICDFDCFNCKFPDCIEDEKNMPKEPRTKKIDWDDPEVRKAYMKKYRLKNEERIKALKHEYYKKNREKLIEQAKRNYYKKRDEM